MSYTRIKTFNAGKTRSGLATVAYSLNGGTSWTTSGVSESPSGSGIYVATITFPGGFTGTLSWTTGDASPRYAAEDVNPADAEGQSVLNAAIGGGTLQDAIQAMAAPILGNLSQSADGTTDTFTDFRDPATTRITSVNSSTTRTVTVH